MAGALVQLVDAGALDHGVDVVGAEVRHVDEGEAVAERDLPDAGAGLGRAAGADGRVVAALPLLLQRGGQLLLGAVVDQVGEPDLVAGQQQQDDAEGQEGLTDAADEGPDPVAEGAPLRVAAVTAAATAATTAAAGRLVAAATTGAGVVPVLGAPVDPLGPGVQAARAPPLRRHRPAAALQAPRADVERPDHLGRIVREPRPTPVRAPLRAVRRTVARPVRTRPLPLRPPLGVRPAGRARVSTVVPEPVARGLAGLLLTGAGPAEPVTRELFGVLPVGGAVAGGVPVGVGAVGGVRVRGDVVGSGPVERPVRTRRLVRRRRAGPGRRRPRAGRCRVRARAAGPGPGRRRRRSPAPARRAGILVRRARHRQRRRPPLRHERRCFVHSRGPPVLGAVLRARRVADGRQRPAPLGCRPYAVVPAGRGPIPALRLDRRHDPVPAPLGLRRHRRHRRRPLPRRRRARRLRPGGLGRIGSIEPLVPAPHSRAPRLPSDRRRRLTGGLRRAGPVEQRIPPTRLRGHRRRHRRPRLVPTGGLRRAGPVEQRIPPTRLRSDRGHGLVPGAGLRRAGRVEQRVPASRRRTGRVRGDRRHRLVPSGGPERVERVERRIPARPGRAARLRGLAVRRRLLVPRPHRREVGRRLLGPRRPGQPGERPADAIPIRPSPVPAGDQPTGRGPARDLRLGRAARRRVRDRIRGRRVRRPRQRRRVRLPQPLDPPLRRLEQRRAPGAHRHPERRRRHLRDPTRQRRRAPRPGGGRPALFAHVPRPAAGSPAVRCATGLPVAILPARSRVMHARRRTTTRSHRFDRDRRRRSRRTRRGRTTNTAAAPPAPALLARAPAAPARPPQGRPAGPEARATRRPTRAASTPSLRHRLGIAEPHRTVVPGEGHLALVLHLVAQPEIVHRLLIQPDAGFVAEGCP